MKKTISISLILIATVLLSSCHVARFFWWNLADFDDGNKFPTVDIRKGNEAFYFHNSLVNYNFSVPSKFNNKRSSENFDHFLEDRKTVAFLVIRNDTILYQKYVEPFTDSTLLPSFSISKAVVTALLGIAINEGYIYSVHEPITKYLPELTNPGFEKITIEHLLNMRSGIRFTEAYANPFADIPKFYYGKNLKRYITKLKIDEPPDQHYNYSGANTLLLSLTIERATGVRISDYLQNKLWINLGMEQDATWNIDSKKHQTIKSFCCINALTIDFAKFGRLYLNKGNWNGRQLIPESWIEKSTAIMNNSRDSQGYPYTYQWRVLPNGAYFAKGVLGQYLLVYPEKNLIFVRMGKQYAGIDWADLFIELSGQL